MTDVTGGDVISQINFTGGFPTNKDLAPSIVFLVAYVLTTPLLIFRLIRPQDRTVLLARPGIFVAARFGMLVVRIIMAKGTYSLGLLIAELVLVSVGFLFLIEPCVTLWSRNVKWTLHTQAEPRWVRGIRTVLTLGLIAAIAISGASGALINNAYTQPGGVDKVRHMREASYILSLAVVALCLLAVIVCYVRFGTRQLQTGYILLPCSALLIVAVYRVVQTYTSDPSAAARSTAAFWILQMFFEFVAFVSLIAISIPAWFPAKPAEARARENAGYEMKAGGV